jgi:hypothetical protein
MNIAPLAAFLSFCVCWPAIAEPKPVRNVEVANAPEARAVAQRARQLGDAVYPQILDLLGDGTPDMPQRLDIVFREHLSGPRLRPGEEVWGCATRETVFLNAGWLCEHPEYLDAVLVHEMAHVAQNYPHIGYRHVWQWYAHQIGFIVAHPFRNYPPPGPTYWLEGIADYVCAKLGYTNTCECPQCDEAYPHYTSGYNCTSAFLLYIDSTYGPAVIGRLNAALRRGNYSDQFFAGATGKTLGELWKDFQTTTAYTPVAADFNELHEALEDDNGKPAKDVAARLDTYLSSHPEIRDFLGTLGSRPGQPPEETQHSIEYFLYIRQQPGGGEAVHTMESRIKDLHQALGYQQGKPPGDLRTRLQAYLDSHPGMKEIATSDRWLERIPLSVIPGAIESLILAQSQAGWASSRDAEEFLMKLKNQGKLPGWRESDHGSATVRLPGNIAKAYPIDRIVESQKKGHSEIYVYSVVKESPDTDWKLNRAWEVSAKGRLLKDYPVVHSY